MDSFNDICLPIEILSSPLWLEVRVFSKFEALYDLTFLSNTSGKAKEIKVGKVTYQLQPNELSTSIRKLKKRWGWKSERKVVDFLRIMEEEGFIKKTKINGRTIIHILLPQPFLYEYDEPHPNESACEKTNEYFYRRIRACIYTGNPKIRKTVFERDGYKCKYCDATENLTLDHIIPVKRGGKDTIKNLQTLCKSCNSSKGAR